MRSAILTLAACLAVGLTVDSEVAGQDCGVPSHCERQGVCAGNDGGVGCPAGDGACSTCRDGKCGRCEPVCGHCDAECKTVPVKKTCFEIECKTICVPAVKFPWESCCQTKCGRLRTIRVLKKSEKVIGEKTACEWKVHSGDCDHCGDGGCCNAVPQSAPGHAPEAPPAETEPAPPRAAVKRASWLRFLRLH